MPGECQLSQVIGASSQPSNLDCLGECQNTADCAFYTYKFDDSLCTLFQTCPIISTENFPTCITGKGTNIKANNYIFYLFQVM